MIEQFTPGEIEMIMALMFVVFVFILIQFKSFFPFLVAKLLNKNLAGILDKAGKLRITTAGIRNGMYFWDNKPQKYLKQFHSAPIWLGSVPMDIMHRDIGYVTDPKYQAALATLEEEAGIDGYDKLYAALRGKDGKTNSLKAEWFTLGEKDMIVPLFFRVPYENILKYANDVPPASLTGEAEDIAFFNQRSVGQTIVDYMPWIIMFVIAIIGGAIAYKILSP